MRVTDNQVLQDESQNEPQACQVVESARKLMQLGLSKKQVEELGIEEPMLQAMCEYARLDDSSTGVDGAVEAALKIVDSEMQRLDLELEMLNMRKRALTKRAKLLRRVSEILGSGWV